MNQRYLDIAIPALLFLFIMAMLPCLPGMEFDIKTGFQAWALYIHKNGLRNAYGATDYMPLYQYFLWLFGKVMGSADAIVKNIHYLRCFTLVFDFLGIWYAYKWIDKKVTYFAILTISILNIAYTYDSIIWGQVDGILSTLIFIAIYYGYKKNNLLSAICLVLAFNFKIQTIVIVPVWGLLFLSNIKAGRLWRSLMLPIIAAVITQSLIVLPFTMGKYGLHEIISKATGSFNKYQSISVKASNMWHWFATGKPQHGKDALVFASDATEWVAGLSYKQAGLILFFVSALFALLPLIILLFKNRKTKNDSFRADKELLWLSSAMVYLLFYFFNTEIHERYCQPAFIFITAYAFYTRRFTPYLLFSIMYFLTLEVSIGHFKFSNYDSLLFNFKFLALLNAGIIIYLGVGIYKNYKLAILNTGTSAT